MKAHLQSLLRDSLAAVLRDGGATVAAPETIQVDATKDAKHGDFATNLALLHGPAWGLRFAEAYEEAGGVLAAAASERLYWLVRDGLACSEEVRLVSRPWREAGRTELTTRVVEERLDAYVTALMDALG